MRRIAVLDAPSNLGLRPPTVTSVPGCAKAPGALRDHGLLTRLHARDAGCLTPPRYDPGDWRPGDGVAHAEQIAAYSRALADRIGAILDAGEFPVILGGDCSILLGSGLAMHRLGEAVGGRIGLVFVDGHSDFRHPGNASYVGAAAGEDLALVTGRGQADLASIEGRRPYFRDIDVVVLGIRAQDEYRLDLQAAGIVTRPVPALRVEGAARSAQWARDQLVDCAGYWLHVDVDVLDPAVMPAVDAPSPGGIAFPELEILLAGLVESPHCLGVEITVFDPDYDPDGSYAEEITNAVAAGLAAARTVTPRPDLIAARADLSAPPSAAADLSTPPTADLSALPTADLSALRPADFSALPTADLSALRPADLSASPAVADHSASPAVADHSASPGVVDHSASPGVADHSASPGVAGLSGSPAAVGDVAADREAAAASPESDDDADSGSGPEAAADSATSGDAEPGSRSVRAADAGPGDEADAGPRGRTRAGLGILGDSLTGLGTERRTRAGLGPRSSSGLAPRGEARGILSMLGPAQAGPAQAGLDTPAADTGAHDPNEADPEPASVSSFNPLAAALAASKVPPAADDSSQTATEPEPPGPDALTPPGAEPEERESEDGDSGEQGEDEDGSAPRIVAVVADEPEDEPVAIEGSADEPTVLEAPPDEDEDGAAGDASAEEDAEAVRAGGRPLGVAPLLDSEPLPATRPGMLRPRVAEERPADAPGSADGFSLPAQRPAFDLGTGSPADIV